MEGEQSVSVSRARVSLNHPLNLLSVVPQALSAAEKSRFEDLAKVDKVRYDKEMKTYVPPKGVGKTGRKKKDPNAPKRPPYVPRANTSHANMHISVISNGFFCFAQVCLLRLLRGVSADDKERKPRSVHRRNREETGREVVETERQRPRAVRAEGRQTAREIREGKLYRIIM